MSRYLPAFLAVLLVSSAAHALPPGAPRSLRSGANHHLGDDSFVEAFGREPSARDSERVRMTTHLRKAHDWLASRPATRPELAERRAKILALLEAYIAKGTTPKNADLPWRTPVFIDSEGTICAVGYLIEQTVGRELPEKIARLHRYDFIEDIAAAVPEVAAWVAESGLTLEEIASIQPAYDGPRTEQWRIWNLAKFTPPDGTSTRYGHGRFKGGNMDGEWKVFAERNDADGSHGETEVVIGRGAMTHGHGPWTSFYPTGEKLAEGRYAFNEPDGAWQIWHRSGNLAAEGSFTRGTRTGTWRFYYDTPGRTPIALGRFARDGSVTGHWRHFDSEGRLIARSWTETPSEWVDDSLRVNGGAGQLLEVLPADDGVTHAIHQGTPGKDVELNQLSLEVFSLAGERLYIDRDLGGDTMYGSDGARLVHDAAGWHASSCHWSAARKAVAQQGDLARLHGLLSTEAFRRARERVAEERDAGAVDAGPACAGEVAISPERARRLDVLLASRDKIRAVTPAMVRDLILTQEEGDGDQSDSAIAERARQRLEASDLVRVLAGHMAMFIEWPHIDRRFDEVYATMAGRYTAHWASYSEELDNVASTIE